MNNQIEIERRAIAESLSKNFHINGEGWDASDFEWAAHCLLQDGYRKESDVAEEIFEEIIDALADERIKEEQKANSALEAQDTISYEIFSYAEDKLGTLLTALKIYKNLYIKKYESEDEE